MQFTSPEILETICCTIWHSWQSSNTKTSDSLGIDLRTNQRIQKELDKSNGDYEGTALQKPHSDHSYEKKTLEFVAEIQAIINNNLSKSVSFIVRNMDVFEFLIRQVVHKDVRYFSYKIRNGHFLSPAMKDEEGLCCKASE